MDSRDFRVQFLYEWESKHNTAAAARNIIATFGNGSVNEHTIRNWYAKFETGDESLRKDDRGRPETIVNNEILRAIVEKNSRQYYYRLCRRSRHISYTIIRHLKLIDKNKKKWINVFLIN